MTKKLFVAPSPHLHSGASTRRIMLDVILALMPAFVVSVVIFGISALLVTLLAVLSCVASEHIISRYVAGEKRSSVGDLSAVLTGLLLGFNLPSSIPWWIVVMGAVVAIGVAKMSFGGIGKNPFNPALVGRVFLLIAYPVQMTTFPQVESSVDIYSGATPLAALKMGGENFTISNVDLWGVASGNISGSLAVMSPMEA
ncbi:MAG: RnfABCDGE type electron transport complex subunit D, partial [Rikenellaceae bacterium]